MKLSLNKDDVAEALKKFYAQQWGVEIEGVKITPFGENIAEVTFDSLTKWEPKPQEEEAPQG